MEHIRKMEDEHLSSDEAANQAIDIVNQSRERKFKGYIVIGIQPKEDEPDLVAGVQVSLEDMVTAGRLILHAAEELVRLDNLEKKQ